jgi:hypothetical protein
MSSNWPPPLLQEDHQWLLRVGDPMRANIDQAITELGLQGTPLFHDRADQ